MIAMRKLCGLLRKKDVGSIGIGAMIVFIAMVLVAGIAASVLVQTANRLEIQAMETGDETTAEVATGIKVIDIEGHKTTRNLAFNMSTGLPWGTHYTSLENNRSWVNGSRIHNMTITVGPRAGSMDIDLSNTVIEISNSTQKCILTYDSSYWSGIVNEGGVFWTNRSTGASVFDLDPDDFGIIELEDADGSCSATTPVINRGDKVMLCLNISACFYGFVERTDVWGMIIPEDGAPGVFLFRTPASYTDVVYDLY
jgi:flagellin FlaB